MSKSIDALGVAVDAATKTSAGKVMTKDNLVDIISGNISALRNVTQFFQGLGDANAKMKAWMDQNARNTAFKSIAINAQLVAGLTGAARKAQENGFLGAISEAATNLTMIMEEFNDNVSKLFNDKTISILNIKVSQVAVFGMINDAETFARFAMNLITVFMSDKSPKLPKPAPYILNDLGADLADTVKIINRTINNKLAKSFVASIIKYRSGGSDMKVVGSDNKASVQFIRANADVTDSDIESGAKGLKIFKWIGDFFVDREDRKLRKLRLERDMITARCQLLQLELSGFAEDSEEYKRQVKIIENYQKMIDRLNQEIKKREENA